MRKRKEKKTKEVLHVCAMTNNRKHVFRAEYLESYFPKTVKQIYIKQPINIFFHIVLYKRQVRCPLGFIFILYYPI